MNCVNVPTAGIAQIERELHATSAEMSLSLSIFILFQGGMPLLWSVISEITGRKVSLNQYSLWSVV